MQYIKLDTALDLVNVTRGMAKILWFANSPVPLRVCWVSAMEFSQYKVGDILVVTVGIFKPEIGFVASDSDAGRNHTRVDIHFVYDPARSSKSVSDQAVNLSEFLATVKRSDGGRGGYSGVPRVPDYGEGEKMEAKTISLPPSLWALVDSMPGKNRSDRIRKLIEDSQTIQLGKLPT